MKKKALISTLISILSLGAVMFFSWRYVESVAKSNLYSSPQNTPSGRVAILLGTVKYTKAGRLNLFYQYRLNAVVKLFNAGKIDCILISGDNCRRGYNEPQDMMDDLISMGIPESKIVLDFAGFRTLDSMIRAKEIFGLQDVLIISQEFHNKRALCIAKKIGLKAIAFNAQDPPRKYSIKVQIRESFARVRMVLDLFIFKTKPKFLGKKENVPCA